ncbi:tetratricopeptide repeat protein [Leifsonia sp. McL0607]|uniref:tetratricopeptide repeat protein n=1 Tax=Leifsonia sp. McL0607 TaxID=3415672 RepID=UPI003CF2BB0F
MKTKAVELIEEIGLDSIAGWNSWNSFTETILRFEAPPSNANVVQFSRDCTTAFDASDPSTYYYPIGQVFEPDVLREVCEIQGIAFSDALSLDYGSGPRIDELRRRWSCREDLAPTERLVLASALVTLSRFEAARQVLDVPDHSNTDTRYAFESALLRYIIGNRSEGRELSPHAMHEVRSIVERGGVPIDRVLDACGLAVVWYIKGVGVAKSDFAWFARHGDRLIVEKGDRIPALSRSAWFRGVAMLTAELGDARKTRELMVRASDAANSANSAGDGVFAENLHKTYLESSTKEFMYVSRDEERAVASATELTELDPHWSVSIGELADALAFFGRAEESARTYDRAADLGAPYVSHHVRRAAAQYEKAGMLGEAVDRHLLAAIMLPDPDSSLAAAERLSTQSTSSARRSFERVVSSLS